MKLKSEYKYFTWENAFKKLLQNDDHFVPTSLVFRVTAWQTFTNQQSAFKKQAQSDYTDKQNKEYYIIIHNEVVGGGGVYWFHSVRPSRMLCLLCNIYSSGWILSILGTNDR